MQPVTEYIYIFGIIIQLIKSIRLKGEEKKSKQDTKSGNLYNRDESTKVWEAWREETTRKT
jgi:hypothetical protein